MYYKVIFNYKHLLIKYDKDFFCIFFLEATLSGLFFIYFLKFEKKII